LMLSVQSTPCGRPPQCRCPAIHQSHILMASLDPARARAYCGGEREGNEVSATRVARRVGACTAAPGACTDASWQRSRFTHCLPTWMACKQNAPPPIVPPQPHHIFPLVVPLPPLLRHATALSIRTIRTCTLASVAAVAPCRSETIRLLTPATGVPPSLSHSLSDPAGGGGRELRLGVHGERVRRRGHSRLRGALRHSAHPRAQRHRGRVVRAPTGLFSPTTTRRLPHGLERAYPHLSKCQGCVAAEAARLSRSNALSQPCCWCCQHAFRCNSFRSKSARSAS
jgi:hypothetical protein